jgi:ADP-ribose pyrophosphatase YjhB (NUDIX family)
MIMSERNGWQKIVHVGQKLFGLIFSAKTLGVRVIALDDSGRIFLVRHSYVRGFHLPGGGVDNGETAKAAAARELAEEGGLTLTTPLELAGFFRNARHSARDHVVLYIARQVRQVEAKAPNWEIVESGFFPLDALPEDATPSTRARIHEFLTHAPPHEIW